MITVRDCKIVELPICKFILIFYILGHGAQNGIFARKTIPKACRFGPAEGLEHRLNSIEDIIDDDELSLVVLNDDGSIVKLGTVF